VAAWPGRWRGRRRRRRQPAGHVVSGVPAEPSARGGRQECTESTGCSWEGGLIYRACRCMLCEVVPLALLAGRMMVVEVANPEEGGDLPHFSNHEKKKCVETRKDTRRPSSPTNNRSAHHRSQRSTA